MEEAARYLGISVRSLRRRLTEEGVSYRDLVASVLQRAAQELLQNGHVSVDETARATGYSETTAFHRAFKRWTGVTPKEFRRTTQ
jgi:AraC-like DNA-binding protein